MLKDQDRIFTNIYGFQDSGLSSAKKRGDWAKTKSLLSMGREKIIEAIKEQNDTMKNLEERIIKLESKM